MQQCIKILLFHIYVKLNMFQATHRRQAHCAWQCPPTTRPTTFHVWKTRGCQCSFGLLVMGGVLPKTCWASYKHGIMKFWYIVVSCWIFLYELYYDARIHEHQVLSGKGLCDEPIPRPEKSDRLCVSLSVIRCNNNPQHLKWMCRKKSEWERHNKSPWQN